MKATAVLGAVFKQREKRPVEVVSSGLSEVDSLTGGLPRGSITEVFGPASSGRTSFMLSTLTQATDHGEICALVDTSGSFDPVSAAANGLALERLLWVRCSANLEHAFKAADLILQGGGFGLVALDLGDVPAREVRRIISSWWYRFRRVLENSPTVLIVLAQDSTVRSCAALSLELRRESGLWSSATRGQETKLSGPIPLRNSTRLELSRLSPGLPSSAVLLKGMQFQVAKRRPLNSHEQECRFSSATMP
ncbi:MAG TPA: hypothetical protein VMM84_04475 [Pyrinomonadaceae bacterium]|nr:hypothetical protein [Pyrinomonadaceae bacterium]